jgi:hypothetical protein
MSNEQINGTLNHAKKKKEVTSPKKYFREETDLPSIQKKINKFS